MFFTAATAASMSREGDDRLNCSNDRHFHVSKKVASSLSKIDVLMMRQTATPAMVIDG